MSLTSMIKQNKDFRNLLLSVSPSRSAFTPAFGSSEMKVPPHSSSGATAAFIGTSSDYIFRFIIGRYLHRDDVLDNLIAEQGIQDIEKRFANVKGIGKIRNVYEDRVGWVKEYLHTDTANQKQFIHAVYYMIAASTILAKLENFRRSGIRSINDVVAVLKYVPDQDTMIELRDLGILFRSVFIKGGVIHKDSKIIFNPHFGSFGNKVSGADADLYVDGVLYDFKSTKYFSYKTDYAAQLTGYCLLNQLCQRSHEGDIGEEMREVAFYYSRYGMICKASAPKADEETLMRFETMIEENEIDTIAKIMKIME